MVLSGDKPFDHLGFVIEYRRLGGRRQSVPHGDKFIVNKWEPEPEDAQQFWETHVEVLGLEEREAIAAALHEVPPS